MVITVQLTFEESLNTAKICSSFADIIKTEAYTGSSAYFA